MNFLKKLLLVIIGSVSLGYGLVPAFYGTYVAFVEPGLNYYFLTGQFVSYATQSTLCWMAAGYAALSVGLVCLNLAVKIKKGVRFAPL